HRGKADTLKILDFGIAKIIASECQESMILSQQGDVFGTPAYMAPEQCVGVASDPRVDIYAAGCIGFELLVGEPPFLGQPSDMMSAHLTTTPEPPSERRPSAAIPSELDEVLLRCLEKSPDQRFQTGRELWEALSRVTPSFPSWAGNTSSRRIARPSILRYLLEELPSEEAVMASTAPEIFDVSGSLRNAYAEVRQRHQACLLDVAMALLDAGAGDVQLAIDVAHLQSLTDDLTGVEVDLCASEEQASSLEQAARARIASLGFSAGELRFERGNAGQSESACQELDSQIRELESQIVRVGSELERKLEKISQKMVAFQARQTEIQQSIDDSFTSLDFLVHEILPRLERHPLVVLPAAQYRASTEERARLDLLNMTPVRPVRPV
ncbi:MAG: protein kinase, partial [Pseudomonadota bacterium]